ncbi:MAG: TonB-dependent receptor [bacterium]|nr:TonB-dependent receptor [bacterium]
MKNKLLQITFVISLIFCIIPFHYAAAQPTAPSEEKNKPAFTDSNFEEEDFFRLEILLGTMVKVASRIEETTFDAPSSVTVFTSEEIENMGITDIYELLNYVPGFQALRDVENGQIYTLSVRGGGRSTDSCKKILFLLDGQRLNESHGGGANSSYRSIPVSHIKQVEIIRGPGSALYGSNAFLGVVSIITDKTKKNIAIRTGDLGLKEMSLQYGDTINNWSFSGYVRAFSEDGQEYTNLSDGVKTTAATKDPRNGIDCHLFIAYKKLSLAISHMERNFSDFYLFNKLGNGLNKDKQTNSFIRLSFQPQITRKISLDVSTSYKRYHWLATAYLFPPQYEITTGLIPDHAVLMGPDLINYAVDSSIHANYNILPNNICSAGAGFLNTGNSYSSTDCTYNPVTWEWGGDGMLHQYTGNYSFVEEKSKNNISAFLQDKHTFTTLNINLIAGVRFDYYTDFGSTVNPRAAVIYSAPWQARIKAMYGDAFRSPALSEQYNKNNPVVVGNPDLTPEKIRTIEGAYLQRLGPTETCVTFFFNKFTDQITSVKQDSGIRKYQNSGETSIYGLEFTLKAELFEALYLRGNYTAIISGTEKNTSKHSGSLTANLKIFKFNININGFYTGKIASISSQAPYVILNSSIRYFFASGISLQCTGYNLLDSSYVTPGQSLEVPNRGRNFQGGIRYTF